MKELVQFLEVNNMGSLATVDAGKPKTRPWGFMLEDNGKLYFCTANTKKVYGQLMKNPAFEFTSTSKEMVTVRVSGEAQFSNDRRIKEMVLDRYPNIKNIYQTADNPIFEVFYIEHGEATFSDFSGKEPRTFQF